MMWVGRDTLHLSLTAHTQQVLKTSFVCGRDVKLIQVAGCGVEGGEGAT